MSDLTKKDQREVDIFKGWLQEDDKVKKVAKSIPDQSVFGSGSGKVLVVGWGGTYGALFTTVKEMQETDKDVDLAHFNYIFPLPKNTAELLSQYETVLVCELNLGQFSGYLRSNFPEVNIQSYCKVQGQPFTVNELKEKCNEYLK